jgi:hypothetical protein
MVIFCYIAPSLRLFALSSLLVFSFPRFLLMTSSYGSVFSFFYFSLFFFLCGYFSPTATTAPSLRMLIPSDSLMSFQSILVPHQYSKLFFFSSGAKLSWVSSGPTFLAPLTLTLLIGSSSVLEGGRPLHNVQSLIFQNPTVDLEICFTISSPSVFL